MRAIYFALATARQVQLTTGTVELAGKIVTTDDLAESPTLLGESYPPHMRTAGNKVHNQWQALCRVLKVFN